METMNEIKEIHAELVVYAAAGPVTPQEGP